MLRIETGEIRNEIFHNWHMWQGIDIDRPFNAGHILGASQRIGPINIHGARAANAFTARTTEGQCWIDLILNPQNGIQNHWSAITAIDIISVDAGIMIIIRIPAVYAEFTNIIGGIGGLGPSLANCDRRILRQRKFDHDLILAGSSYQ